MTSWNNASRIIVYLILMLLLTGFSNGTEAERPPSLRTRQKIMLAQGERSPDETSNRQLNNNNHDNAFRASCSKRLSTGTNGDLSAYGQMFNVRRPANVIAINYLSITSFELYTDIIDPTMNVTYQLYSREGNYQTAKADMRFWTLVASGSLQGKSSGVPQVLPQVLDLPVSHQDGRAFYITLTTKDLIYSKGRGTQGDKKVQQANQDLEIWEGVGILSYPAQQSYVIGPRMFLGALRYKTSSDCTDDIFDDNGNNNMGGRSSSKVKLSFFSEHSNRFGLDKIVNGINENAKDALQEILLVDETLKSYALRNNLKIDKVESTFVPLDERAPRCIPSGTKTISETICSVVDTIATFSHTAMSESGRKALRESILSHGDGVMLNKIDNDGDFDNTQYIGVQITNDVVEIELSGTSREMNSKEQQVFQEAFIKVLNPVLRVTEDILISKATVTNQMFSTAVRSRKRQRRRRISTDLSPIPSSKPTQHAVSRDPIVNMQPLRTTRSIEEDDDIAGRNTITIAFAAESRSSESSLELIVTKALLNHEIYFLRFLKSSVEKEYFRYSYINDLHTSDDIHDDDDDDGDKNSGNIDQDANDSGDDDSNSKGNIGAILGTVASFVGVGVIGVLIFTGACSCFGLSTICWVSKKRKAEERQRQEDRRNRLKHFAHRVSSRVLAHHPTRRNEKEQYEHENRNSSRKDKLQYFSDMVSRRVFQVPPRSSGDSAAKDAEQNTASSTVDTASKSLAANNARRSRQVENHDSQGSDDDSSMKRSSHRGKESIDVLDVRGDYHTTMNPSKDLDDCNDRKNEMNRSDHRGAKPRRGMDMSTSSRGSRRATEGMGSQSEHNRRKLSMDFVSNQTDQLHKSDHHRPQARRGTMDTSTSSRGHRQRYDMKRPSMDTASNRTDTSSLHHSSYHRDEEDFADTSPGRQRHSDTYQDHSRDRLNKSERQPRRSTMDNSASYLDHKPITSRSEHQRRKRPSMDFNPGEHHRASDAMNRSDHHRPRPSESLDLDVDKYNDKEMNRSGQGSRPQRRTMDMISTASSRASSSRKGKSSEHRRDVVVANSLDQADRERLNKSEHYHRRRPSMDLNSSGHQRSTVTSRPDHSLDYADRERLNKSEHNHRRRPSMDLNSSGHQRSTVASRPDHSLDYADQERLNKSEHNHRRRPSMDMNSSGHQRSTMTSRSEHRRGTTASMDIVEQDRMTTRDMKRSSRQGHTTSRSEHRRRVSKEIFDRDRRREPVDTSTSGYQAPSTNLESRSEHRRTTTSMGAEDSNRMNQSERQPRRGTMDLSTSSRNRRRHG